MPAAPSVDKQLSPQENMTRLGVGIRERARPLGRQRAPKLCRAHLSSPEKAPGLGTKPETSKFR